MDIPYPTWLDAVAQYIFPRLVIFADTPLIITVDLPMIPIPPLLCECVTIDRDARIAYLDEVTIAELVIQKRCGFLVEIERGTCVDELTAGCRCFVVHYIFTKLKNSIPSMLAVNITCIFSSVWKSTS